MLRILSQNSKQSLGVLLERLICPDAFVVTLSKVGTYVVANYLRHDS